MRSACGERALAAKSLRIYRLRANGSLKLLMIRSWDRRGRATRNQSGQGILFSFFFFYFTWVSTFDLCRRGQWRATEMFDLSSRT